MLANPDLSVDIGDNQPEADGNHHACDDLLIAFPVDITELIELFSRKPSLKLVPHE